MKHWNNRPFDVANLYNPAYLGRILVEYIDSYKIATKKGIPLEIIYVTFPLIIVKSLQKRLPKKSNAIFHKWLIENSDLKFNYFNTVIQYLPFIKEAIIFLLQRNIIALEKNTLRINKQIRKTLKSDTNEIKQTLKKASFMGKWVAKIDDSEVIYSLMEVQV